MLHFPSLWRRWVRTRAAHTFPSAQLAKNRPPWARFFSSGSSEPTEVELTHPQNWHIHLFISGPEAASSLWQARAPPAGGPDGAPSPRPFHFPGGCTNLPAHAGRNPTRGMETCPVSGAASDAVVRVGLSDGAGTAFRFSQQNQQFDPSSLGVKVQHFHPRSQVQFPTRKAILLPPWQPTFALDSPTMLFLIN